MCQSLIYATTSAGLDEALLNSAPPVKIMCLICTKLPLTVENFQIVYIIVINIFMEMVIALSIYGIAKSLETTKTWAFLMLSSGPV